MNSYKFARVSVCSPKVFVGNPAKNAEGIKSQLKQCVDSDVVVFPEMSVCGYTVADLVRQDRLLCSVEDQVAGIASSLKGRMQLVFVGAPIRVNGELFNCAVAIFDGEVVGIVPKQHIPNYGEFQEKRWFKSAGLEHQNMTIPYANRSAVPFGIDLLFASATRPEFIIHAEVCEDGWVPVTPFSIACMHGAVLGVNLSASPETVAKAEYRAELVKSISGRCVAAYAYSSAGPSESTTDLVFSGHCLIGENSNLLKESSYVGDGTLNFDARMITADIDVGRLIHDRTMQETFFDGRRLFPRTYRTIKFYHDSRMVGLKRNVAATPFVPSNPQTLAKRCAGVFDIQCAGLARRINHILPAEAHIGISGGLDSTHALLVAHKTATATGRNSSWIVATTMPGFGTTKQSKEIADRLMKSLGVRYREIDIRPACVQTWLDMGHKPFGIDLKALSIVEHSGKGGADLRLPNEEVARLLAEKLKLLTPEQRAKGDLVFENVQARERTKVLMNSGFVIGTGDLSELALGWCTYNGDHMSMYGVNAGVPKTLIRFMVNYVAANHYTGEAQSALVASAQMPISPELLPADVEGKIAQQTEQVVGPYVLHDFFFLNIVRYGFTPEKTLWLAQQSELGKMHSLDDIRGALKVFLTRFFGQQFKRSCLPDGPKVGTLSLSPRGDWRMPTDADPTIWLEHSVEQ